MRGLAGIDLGGNGGKKRDRRIESEAVADIFCVKHAYLEPYARRKAAYFSRRDLWDQRLAYQRLRMRLPSTRNRHGSWCSLGIRSRLLPPMGR